MKLQIYLFTALSEKGLLREIISLSEKGLVWEIIALSEKGNYISRKKNYCKQTVTISTCNCRDEKA